MASQFITRHTLIQKAKQQNDRAAWEEFERYYRDFILMVLRKMRVHPQDQPDLAQEILLKIWNNLEKVKVGEGNPQFRTWLSQVIRNTTLSFFSKEKRRLQAGHCYIDNIGSPEASNEFFENIQKDWEKHVVDLALEKTRGNFSEKTFQIFLLSQEGLTAEEICQKLQITKNSMYVLKNRVKTAVLHEIRNIREHIEF